MAAIPEYRRKIALRPANQQSIQVNTSPDTFGASIGRALDSVGNGLFSVADAIDYRDQLTEDAKAREAFNAYRYDQREALRAPETGYLNRTGANAIGVQQSAEERLRTLRERYGDGLSPRARRRYDELVDSQQDQAHASLLSHTSNETRNYVLNQRKSTIEGYLEEAATNWHDPALFEENLGLALDEQNQLAELQGWDPATRQSSAEALVSDAFRRRIVLAASVDPIAAQALLEQSRDVLNAEDEHALDTNLKGLVLDAKADQFTRQFIRRGSQTGGVPGGQRTTAHYDATDRPEDNVAVTFSMGPARPERPNQEIIDVITSAAEATFGAGTRVVVGSGAEGDNPQHGSNRHETGMAADVAIYRPDGSLVKATDDDAASFARAAAIGGALGIGYGAEYMGGTNFHIDMVVPGGGQGHYWASGARAIGPELVALMDRGAANALASTPYENSFVNRGIVSQLGTEVGITLIGAAKNTPYISAKVALPPEMLAANPNFAGMTVGEVYDTIATAVGDDPASRGGRAYFDAQAAYEAALRIENPEERDAVMRRIDATATLQDRARAEERRTAQEAAWNEYTSTGRTDFPMSTRQAMGQSGWISFQEAVRNDQRGVDSTDPDTWEMLTRLASSDPKAFADLSLSTHYPSLSRADRRQFIALQESTKAALEGARQDAADGRNEMNFGKALTAADTVYQAMVDPTPPQQMDQEHKLRRLHFQQELMQLMQDFYDRESREPSTLEVREMATTLALPADFSVPHAGFLRGGFDLTDETSGALFDAARRGSDTKFHLAVKYEDVPVADRTRIAAQLMQANGGEMPTEEAIVSAYEQQRLLEAGLPPIVDISEVPQWLIDEERRDNPTVTDDELVELYQLFLMSQQAQQ